MKHTTRIIRHALATLAGALIAAVAAEPLPRQDAVVTGVIASSAQTVQVPAIDPR